MTNQTKKAKLVAPLLLAASMMAPSAAFSKESSSFASFSVYFKNVPVAKFKQTVSVNGNRYSVSGKARTNKFVSVISKSKGVIQASGTIKGTTLVPDSTSTTYNSGKRKGATSLSFSGNKVVKVSSSPKRKIKPGTVPLKESHKSNVVDPVSTVVFPVKNGASASGQDVCNRTVPVFNGSTRLDLKFSYKGKAGFRPEGYGGPVYTCSVKYVPIAGYRPSSKGTKFMRNRTDIEVQMARVGDSNVFTLVGFKVPTRAGIVAGQANSFTSK